MLRNVFESLRHPWRTLAIFAALMAVMIAIMTAQSAPLKTAVTPRGIVDLELAGTQECAANILAVWKPGGTRVAIVNTLLDFLFIPCYATTLALICFLLARLTKRVSPLSMLFLLWG